MRFDLRISASQHAANLMAAGCAVVFTSQPALSGTYALDSTTLTQIGSVARDAASGLGLPFGATNFTYPERDGTPHSFIDTQIIALYKVLRDYTAGLAYYGSGQLPTPPPQPSVIA